MQDTQVSLDNSSTSATVQRDVERTISLAECSLSEVLNLESTLARGELSSNTAAGAFLYISPVSPRHMESTIPTRVSYVSRLFCQWNGAFEFKLYVTKAIFQQTKLLMVFVPGATPAQVRATPVDALLGYQMRTVLNPDNNVCATLTVPFVSKMNWLDINESTGCFAVLLMERIITTQQTNSPIPWVLTMCSPRGSTQLMFRYSVVPPIQLENRPGDDDTGGGITPPDSEVGSLRGQIGVTYAKSCTASRTRKQMVFGRVSDKERLYLYQPVFGSPQQALTGIAIPIADLPASSVVARRLSLFALNPPFTFATDAPTARKSIVPYLPCIPTVYGALASTTKHTTRWWSTSNNSVEGGYVYFGSQQSAFMFEFKMPSDDLANAFDRWWVSCLIHEHNTNQVQLIRMQARKTGTAQLKLEWKSQTCPAQFSGLGVKYGTPIIFVDDPYNYSESYNNLSIVPWLTSQIDALKSLSLGSHFMLYTSADEEGAKAIRQFLLSREEINMPQNASGAYVSLSLSQGGPVFNMLDQPDDRAVFTWLFSLFSSDTDSPLYRIARILDLVFEIAVPLVVNSRGETPPVAVESTYMKFENVQVGFSALDRSGIMMVDDPADEYDFGEVPPDPEENEDGTQVRHRHRRASISGLFAFHRKRSLE